MRRPGTDENDVQMSDVQCDFCHQPWTDDRFMVEGHQGACICSECLTRAYRTLVLKTDLPAAGPRECVLCRESRPDPLWANPAFPDVCACLRCVKQSAAVLQKDPDFGWRKPDC